MQVEEQTKEKAQVKALSTQIVQFFTCVSGIYFSFMISALFQEKVATRTYMSRDRTEENLFPYPIFIVLFSSVSNVLFCVGKLTSYSTEVAKETFVSVLVTDQANYVYAGISFVFSTLLSYTALVYVSFPTQVLAKSCKLVPIMISTIIVARKAYPLCRYVTVFVITIAISGFMLDRISSSVDDPDVVGDSSHGMIGVIMLVGSLVSDGILNGVQTNIYSKLPKTEDPGLQSDKFMFYVNIYAAVICFALCLFYNNEFIRSIAFIIKHEGILWDLFIQSACKAFGQMFIFRAITLYGPLVSGMICTTRKFFTILFSILLYRHSVSLVQWCCIGLVFGSLTIDAYVTVKPKTENMQTGVEEKPRECV